jgi:SAM-dependent methyltransferase
MKAINAVVHRFGRAYTRELCRREFEAQQFVRINERPIEFRFVFEQLTRLNPKTVLDVGTGTTALPHLMRNCGYVVTAADNVRDYWPAGMFNRHYHVIDDDITTSRLDQRFDVVTCVSVLEHIANHDAAMHSMLSLLTPGGHLIVTFPYSESTYVDNVYKRPGAGYGWDNPYICQVYSRAQLDRWTAENDASIVAQEYWQCFEGELWTFGTPVQPPRRVDKADRHQLSCVLIQKH